MSYELPSNSSATGVGRLREIVTERQLAHGGWCMVPSPLVAEVVSASGCDWLCIDLQHGLIDEATMRVMVQAAGIRGTPVAVRVAWNEPGAIMRALDAGADGIIVPMVNTAAEARRAVEACHYPPLGHRSWGPLRSTLAQPGFNPAKGNEQTVCLVMIETTEGVENISEILDVAGQDGVMVGPHDLAISHSGTNTGAASSPRDVEMIELIAAECAKRGLVAGISCGSGAEARRWEAAGYTLFGLASDAALIGYGMTAQLSEARESGDNARGG